MFDPGHFGIASSEIVGWRLSLLLRFDSGVKIRNCVIVTLTIIKIKPSCVKLVHLGSINCEQESRRNNNNCNKV
jgi:hypothetical protein